MNKGKGRLVFLIIFIVVLLIVPFFIMRFDVDPFSYFSKKEEVKEETEKNVNLNGIYIQKESIDKTISFFSGCTVSYFNNYLVVVNEEYHMYRESCIGTFYIDSGKTSELDFSDLNEKGKYVSLSGVDYYKNEYLDYVYVNNYFIEKIKEIGAIYPENYKILFEESMGKQFFAIKHLDFKMTPAVFQFNLLKNSNLSNELQIVHNNEVVYIFSSNSFDELPDLKAFGSNLVIIETLSDHALYQYNFKVLTKEGISYDLDSKFPITIDGVKLTSENSIFVKYNPSDNNFIMLVGNDKEFCKENSESEDIAYYVFSIDYNYSSKNFEKPEFLRIVYKKDGCKYVNEVMRW